MKRSSISFIIAACALILSTGCTKQDSSSGNSGETGSLASDCGTVYKGNLKLPIDKSDASKGTVTVIGSNLLMFKTGSDSPRLVKLHNIAVMSDDVKARAAKKKLQTLAAEGDVYFYQATKDCQTTLDNGTEGSIGQFYSAKGTNFSEAIINAGLAEVDTDECNGSLLSDCYSALQDTAAQSVAGELEEFLWKPVSDSNGKLAVHSGPSDVSVIVNGERGTDQGGGNGFGSLARFTKPGCSYGANVKVQVIDSKTGGAYLFNGSDSLTIPNGCSRYCIKNGAIALCPKN